ncbi:MAG: hypothetical protein N3G78_03440 [Desulfobacterota bacterium]|nr:hypothetical protein [Thermodesulfobacteriota bacterium]
MNEKRQFTPCACFSHDDKAGRLKIELELPGARKESISLDMRKDSFCVTAPRGDDVEYAGCYMLAHEIHPDKAEAKFENGLLRIYAPLKDWEYKVSIPVQ